MDGPCIGAFLFGVVLAFMPGLSLILKQPPVKLEDVDPMHNMNAGVMGKFGTMVAGPQYVDPHQYPAARKTQATPLL